MNRWIIGCFLAICLAVAAYFLLRPKDDCDYATHAKKAGVDFGATIEHVTAVKGNLGLSEADLTTLDQFRQDYAQKYSNLCHDWKRKAIANDLYNCRRENMDRVLDQFRLLSTVSNAKDKDQVAQALAAIKQFGTSGNSVGCSPAAHLVVNPLQLSLSNDGTTVWTQVTNIGNKDARYSFDQLPLSFIPSPASGSVLSGQMVSVVFVRTKYPVPDKEINFVLRDDSSEEIRLKITLEQLQAEVYSKLGTELRRATKGAPTLDDTVAFVKNKWRAPANQGAQYLVAANLLDSVGNKTAASRAAEMSVAADTSLQTNPAAQITLALYNTKSGDTPNAQAALSYFSQSVASGPEIGSARYFTGVSNLKLGNWQYAADNLCRQETRDWVEHNPDPTRFAEKELEVKSLNYALQTTECPREVFRVAAEMNRSDSQLNGTLGGLFGKKK